MIPIENKSTMAHLFNIRWQIIDYQQNIHQLKLT